MSIWTILEDLNHVDKLIRNAAYVRLLDEGQDAMPELVDAYHEIEGMAQLMVVRAFGELGDDRAVPILLDAMADRLLWSIDKLSPWRLRGASLPRLRSPMVPLRPF